MSHPGRALRSTTSGQALLVGILILAALIVTIPLLVEWTQHLNKATAASNASITATEGFSSAISHVTWALEQDTYTWVNVLGGDATTISNLGFDGNTAFIWSDLNRFTVKLSTGSPALSYQVRAAITGLDQANNPVRTVEMMLSQKTLGATLPTGEHATAALAYYGSTPLIDPALNPLTVDWGPIINFSGDIQFVSSPVGYPRLYALGAISPYAMNAYASSDGKSYWAFTYLGESPLPAISTYTALAMNTSIKDPGNSLGAMPGFAPNGNGQAFGSTGNYVMASTTSVIYLTGLLNNTTFQSIGMNVGAFITDSNLVLDNGGGSTGQIDPATVSVAVPPTALLEYPTHPFAHTPFNVLATQTCSLGQPDCPLTSIIQPTPHVDFRGFLYVRGDLIVKSGDWLIVGQVRVDGKINITGGTLHILQDDLISHSILVDRTVIEASQMRMIPARGPDWIQPANIQQMQ